MGSGMDVSIGDANTSGSGDSKMMDIDEPEPEPESSMPTPNHPPPESAPESENGEEDDGDSEDDDDDPSDVAMVPMADMLNARYGCENVRFSISSSGSGSDSGLKAKLFYEEKELKMISTKFIPAGSQIVSFLPGPATLLSLIR